MSLSTRGWIAVTVLAVSCGGSNDTEPSPEPDVPVETGGTPTTAEPSADQNAAPSEPVAIDLPACDALTTEQVEAATALSVVDTAEDGPATCVYDLGDDVGVDVFVSLEDGSGSFRSPSTVFAGYADELVGGGAERVSGVGADALYSPSLRAIAVDAGGGRYFVVGVNGGFTELEDPRDALVTLAGSVLEQL